jgi:DnaK suppressor protein
MTTSRGPAGTSPGGEAVAHAEYSAGMTDIDTSQYRARLLEEQERLVDAVEFLKRENPGSISDELGDIVTAGDENMGDTATATYDRELDEGLGEGAQETLLAIDDALRKIEDGTYGACEVCGKSIGPERLTAIPWARLCIDDQRKADS